MRLTLQHLAFLSDNVLPVECMEQNMVHQERRSVTAPPSPTASWNITTCLLCFLGALSRNNHCSSDGISRGAATRLSGKPSDAAASRIYREASKNFLLDRLTILWDKQRYRHVADFLF
jgi:hypothetical protein